MSTLWFQSKQMAADGAIPSQTEPLQKLLGGTESPQATAERLALTGFSQYDAGWRLWNLIFDAAAEIPESHDSLIALMLELKRVEKDQSNPAEQLKTFNDEFGMDWRDRYDSLWAYRDGSGFESRQALEAEESRPDRKWINFNAFSAKLSKSEYDDETTFGLVGLQDALEFELAKYYEKHTPQENTLRAPQLSPQEMLDVDVTAAAQWILYAGSLMFRDGKTSDEEVLKIDRVLANSVGSDLWKGPAGFSHERWNLWKERFSFMEALEDLNAEARSAAGDAKKRMEQVEHKG